MRFNVFKSIAFALVCFSIFNGVSAHAQEATGLRDLIDGILGQEGKVVPKAGQTDENGRIVLRDLAQSGFEARERRLPRSKAQIDLSFAPLVAETQDAVVNIYADRIVRERSPFANDPFFEQFFNRRFRRQQRSQNSLGSGVIVEASGIIVTNNHVVERADNIRVVLGDGVELQARLLAQDTDTDLAVLKVEAGSALPVIPLGNSEDLLVGDLVLAIGNPFGVGKTVTSGIVSAVARSRRTLSDFGFFIQTDAAINPGNSGGALIDMRGQLIGINTAIFSRSGGSNGIGFAVPSNIVRAVLDAALQNENIADGSREVEQPYIGVSGQEVSSDIAAQLGLAKPGGVLVISVDQGSPAALAGIQAGDVIIGASGSDVMSPPELNYHLFTSGIGSTVPIVIQRRDRQIIAEVKLLPQPKTPEGDMVLIEGDSPFAGAEFSQISSALLTKFRVRTRNAQGVIVTNVIPGSPAQGYLQVGDIVRSVNGVEIAQVDTMREVTAQQRRNWRYVVERRGGLIRQFVRR